MTIRKIGFWAHIALLFLVRSGRATAALSAMVIAAVGALIFLSALAVGVHDAMLRNTVGLFSGHITARGLDGAIRPGELKAKGVAGVLKRVFLPGVLSYGDLDQPLTMCALDPALERSVTAFSRKIVAGRYPQNGRDELMLSEPMAKALGVELGDTLVFTAAQAGVGSLGLMLSAIYRSGIDQLDSGIAFCPLGVLPDSQLPWSAAVFLDTGVDALQVVAEYRQRWPGTYRFDTWETTMPDLRQLIDLEYISMGIVIVLVLGVVALGIACSFVIFIIKNMREYGIMKAMGVTTGEMTMLIVMKVVIMNGIACAAGVLAGTLIVWGVGQSGGIDLSVFTSYNRYFSVSGVIYPRLTGFSLVAPPAAATLFSLAAAVWPAALVARRKAADVLRMI